MVRGAGQARSDSQRGLVVLHRLVELVGVTQSVAPVDVRFGIIGLDAEGALEMRDRVVRAVHTAQRNAQVVVGLRKIGLDP